MGWWWHDCLAMVFQLACDMMVRSDIDFSIMGSWRLGLSHVTRLHFSFGMVWFRLSDKWRILNVPAPGTCQSVGQGGHLFIRLGRGSDHAFWWNRETSWLTDYWRVALFTIIRLFIAFSPSVFHYYQYGLIFLSYYWVFVSEMVPCDHYWHCKRFIFICPFHCFSSGVDPKAMSASTSNKCGFTWGRIKR